jgi:hypothetical protein
VPPLSPGLLTRCYSSLTAAKRLIVTETLLLRGGINYILTEKALDVNGGMMR